MADSTRGGPEEEQAGSWLLGAWCKEPTHPVSGLQPGRETRSLLLIGGGAGGRALCALYSAPEPASPTPLLGADGLIWPSSVPDFTLFGRIKGRLSAKRTLLIPNKWK